MHQQVYITNIISIEISKTEISKPRDRFVHYYEDLHKLYKNNLTHETFYQGGQHSFSSLGDRLFEKLNANHLLNNVDILIPTYWSHEFDPDYSNCGPYLKEKYQLTCDLFDIYDQGTLAGFTSLHLLQKYLLSGQYHKGMLIALEQTTIPRNSAEHHVIPTHNGACALLIQSENTIKQFNQLAFKIIDVSIFDASQLHKSMKSNLDAILDLLNQILPNQIINIVAKRNTVTWKQLQYEINRENQHLIKYTFTPIPSEPSILSMFDYLIDIMSNKFEGRARHIVIIEEDIETLNVGVLILEVVNFL